jgi:hypothetical protein
LVDIDDRLILDLILHRRHVEPVDLVPVRDAVLDVRSAGEGGEENGGLRGDHETAGCEPLVTGVEYGVEHAFVEKAVALWRKEEVSVKATCVSFVPFQLLLVSSRDNNDSGGSGPSSVEAG